MKQKSRLRYKLVRMEPMTAVLGDVDKFIVLTGMMALK